MCSLYVSDSFFHSVPLPNIYFSSLLKKSQNEYAFSEAQNTNLSSLISVAPVSPTPTSRQQTAPPSPTILHEYLSIHSLSPNSKVTLLWRCFSPIQLKFMALSLLFFNAFHCYSSSRILCNYWVTCLCPPPQRGHLERGINFGAHIFLQQGSWHVIGS